MFSQLNTQLQKCRAAIAFYTVLPVVSQSEELAWQGIALYGPLVGVGLGLILAGLDWGLGVIQPELDYWRAWLLVLVNIWLTGGLHLDGAMDTADGLAVSNPERRLEVMADSRTGAFGAMALVVIIISKWLSLAVVDGWVLPSVMAWSRWGQLRAIQAFPYLKAAGKGKFHQEGITLPQVQNIGASLAVSILLLSYKFSTWQVGILLVTIPFLTTWAVGSWLNRQLGGQTGDTYGAIVEWTEAISLLLLTGMKYC